MVSRLALNLQLTVTSIDARQNCLLLTSGPPLVVASIQTFIALRLSKMVSSYKRVDSLTIAANHRSFYVIACSI